MEEDYQRACSRYVEHFGIEKSQPNYNDPTIMLSRLEEYLNDKKYQVCVCEKMNCDKCDGHNIDCECMNADYLVLSTAKGSMHSNCAYIIDLITQYHKQPKIRQKHNAYIFLLSKDSDEIPLFEIIGRTALKILFTESPMLFTILDGGTFNKGTLSLRFNYME